MDNIPEEDLIEHEKQKGGSSYTESYDDKDDSDQPPLKQPHLPAGTIHGPLPHIPPHIPMMNMMPPPPIAMSMMMGMQPPMPPPPLGMPPPPIMMPPGIPPPPPPTQQQQTASSSSSSGTTPKPLFPAAANLEEFQSESPQQHKNKIETVSSGTKIIHPDEDISLVS